MEKARQAFNSGIRKRRVCCFARRQERRVAKLYHETVLMRNASEKRCYGNLLMQVLAVLFCCRRTARHQEERKKHPHPSFSFFHASSIETRSKEKHGQGCNTSSIKHQQFSE